MSNPTEQAISLMLRAVQQMAEVEALLSEAMSLLKDGDSQTGELMSFSDDD